MAYNPNHPWAGRRTRAQRDAALERQRESDPKWQEYRRVDAEIASEARELVQVELRDLRSRFTAAELLNEMDIGDFLAERFEHHRRLLMAERNHPWGGPQ